MCYDFVLGMLSRIQDCLETSCNHTSTVKNGGQGIGVSVFAENETATINKIEKN